MRFVLFFIVSSFFFFSPFQGEAKGLWSEQSKTNIDNANTTELPYYSISDDYAGAAIYSNARKSSITQYRYYPVNNFIIPSTFQDPVNFYEEKLFVQPHLYCKRIGLKLVFPAHYFW